MDTYKNPFVSDVMQQELYFKDLAKEANTMADLLRVIQNFENPNMVNKGKLSEFVGVQVTDEEAHQSREFFHNFLQERFTQLKEAFKNKWKIKEFN